MNTHPITSDQDISITLPLRINFLAIETFLKKKFVDTNISKMDTQGKTTNYFRILDLNLSESHADLYNLELRMQLQTLTLLFHKKDIDVSIQTQLSLNVATQKLSVDTYKINSQGDHWLANNILKSMLNTFIYKKIIKTLSVDLRPLLDEKIDGLNAKLASKLETNKGISILGKIENFTISHFEIKKSEIWVLINTSGWCVIAIEDLEF